MSLIRDAQKEILERRVTESLGSKLKSECKECGVNDFVIDLPNEESD